MAITQVPEALVERIGQRGADGLVELLRSAGAEWRDEVLTLAEERFERRLTHDISALRVDVLRELAAFKVDLAGFRVELAGVRVELLKWSFLFWIGQVAAMAGLLAFMLRM